VATSLAYERRETIMDAITLLERDHNQVESLFREFERSSDQAEQKRGEIASAVIDALVRHATAEEQFLYPAIRERSPAHEDATLEALEEHHVVKWLLFELSKMQPNEERFEAKMSVLIDNVRHHIEEEREQLFPVLRKAFEQQELEDLGALIEEAERVGPTRPHPRAPDTPPGNLLAGAVAAVLDRGRGLLSGQKRAPRKLAAKTSRPRAGRSGPSRGSSNRSKRSGSGRRR
jgi:hemerythrin superfamily protein